MAELVTPRIDVEEEGEGYARLVAEPLEVMANVGGQALIHPSFYIPH